MGPDLRHPPCHAEAMHSHSGALSDELRWRFLGFFVAKKTIEIAMFSQQLKHLDILDWSPGKKKTGFIRFNQVSWGLWGLESSHGYENHIETDWNPFFWCWGNHPTGLHLAAIHGHKAYRAIHGAGRWIPTCAQHRSPSYVGNIR